MTDIETAIEITQRQIEELKSNLPTLVTQEYYDSFNLAIEVKQKAIQALQEKAEREKLQDNCACMTNSKACCTCVSMRCRYCVKQSNYTRGSFCSACGRKLNNAPTDEQ